jgi:hypothetical protein
MKHLAATLALCLVAASAHGFPWYASGDNIRGAELMTPQERQAHVARLRSMKTLAECQAYWDAHNSELDARAAKQQIKLPPPQGNPCEAMARMGKIR